MNEAHCRESMVCGRPLRGVAVGAGYFSQFHYDAWRRIGDATLVALCNRDRARGEAMATRYGVPKVYTNLVEMLDTEGPDFIDVITPPDTHAEFCARAAERGIDIICQKALARTFDESAAIVRTVDAAGVRLMVHDNFRFQPWHREMRRLIDRGAIGRLHSISSRTRMGDGWAEDAYVSRQPYFRTMPQLLIFETGVHFIDVFRFLAGEVGEVYARLRRLNPAIAGEDCAVVLFQFADGATGVWDANRYNESLESDPRYTFGEFLLEGSQGAIRLLEDGRLLVHPLGGRPQEHVYAHARRGFAGDCCFVTIRHFIDRLLDGRPFETNGADYLRTLAVQQAVYESAAAGRPVRVSY